MKNLIYYLAAISSIVVILYMCEPVKPPVKTVISGIITNPIGDTVKVFNQSHSFISRLNHKGEFMIKMEIDSADYFTFHHGVEATAMYVNSGDCVKLTIDTELFDETIKYTNSEESSFLAKKYLMEESLGDSLLTSSMRTVPYDNFINFWSLLEEQMHLELIDFSNQHFVDLEQADFDRSKDYWIEDRRKFDLLPKKGEPAIDFSYPDRYNNIVSLSDFKGQYVYVDVWATWCGPCRYEIPYLVELEKEYHNQNIVFMSVSVDTDKDKSVWLEMLDEENMGGVQLITSGWGAKISKDYMINSIPRFMLFDTDGNIISLDAPRPSSDEIRTIFNQML